jgi:hypothetical protein
MSWFSQREIPKPARTAFASCRKGSNSASVGKVIVSGDPPPDQCESERERQSIARPLHTESDIFSRRLGMEIEGEITVGARDLPALWQGGGKGHESMGRGKRGLGCGRGRLGGLPRCVLGQNHQLRGSCGKARDSYQRDAQHEQGTSSSQQPQPARVGRSG